MPILDEFSETLFETTLSQAAKGFGFAEGATTRSWVPTIIDPRASSNFLVEDIVWAAWQHAEMVIKKSMITIWGWSILRLGKNQIF